MVICCYPPAGHYQHLLQAQANINNSWMHPKSKHWIIKRLRDLLDFLNTRATRRATYSIDHVMIKSTSKLRVRRRMRKEMPIRKLAFNTIIINRIRDNLQVSLLYSHDQLYKHICMQNHNDDTIKTSEDSHFIERVVCERELETEQNCNILTPTPIATTEFLSRSLGLLNQEPGGPASLGAGFLYRILNPTDWTSCAPSYILIWRPIFLWVSQIALIQPVHGQGYILIFLARMHLLFTQVHFLFWQLCRVEGQYTTSLNDRLVKIPAGSGKEKWNAIKSIVYKESKEKLGSALRKYEV